MTTNCDEVRHLLIDYSDGLLSPAIRTNVDAHLQYCAKCQQEVDEYKKLFQNMASTQLELPSPALKENFQVMLQSELNIAATMHMLKSAQSEKSSSRHSGSLFLRIAAGLVLLFTGALGGYVFKNQPGQKTASEMANLRDEIQKMKEVMLLSLLNEESASDRIRAVSYAEELKSPNQKILGALLQTVNGDQNVNVRLAAINSIARFSNDPAVMDSLIASLRKQTEPLVQIVLITILTDKKEVKAIEPIREIISNKQTLAPVKEIAEQKLKEVM